MDKFHSNNNWRLPCLARPSLAFHSAGHLFYGMGMGMVLCLLLLGLPACQSSPKAPDATGRTMGETRPFIPKDTQANIQLMSGRYPNLFANESRAEWVTEPQQAKSISAVHSAPSNSSSDAPHAMTSDLDFGPNSIRIVCHLISRFSEASVGFDAVRLRGIKPELLLPDGHSVTPVQSNFVSDLEEEASDTALQFSRTVCLVFNKSALSLATSTGGATTTVRLILEGYDTTFYFAWEMQAPDLAE